MLISEQREAFNSPDWIYEVKLDGIRCIAYMDSNVTDLRNKRDKKLIPHLPELSEIHKQVSKKCILDGEVFVLKNGITDFYEIQRRSLLTDPFKIHLTADKHPAAFTAYDVIYLDNKQVTDLPLMERKKILQDIISENKFLSMSRYIQYNGIELFKQTKQNGLEGIVAKRKDSRYYFDKRSKDWIKCKVMASDDCIICGYIQKANHMTSLVLGQYDNDTLVYKGHVTLGVSLGTLNKYKYQIIENSPFGYVPEGNDNVVWLAPELVCIVESMPTGKVSFRQPVFKGIRDDKTAEECTVN